MAATSAADRVAAFLEERRQVPGLDPLEVQTVNGERLTVTDLKILVRKARKLEAVLPVIDELSERVRLEARP